MIIKTSWFPFKPYVGMAVWPFIFVRGEVSETVINHEKIHLAQQLEMALIFFYLWYGIEFLIRLCIYWDGKLAYRRISFEQEAYEYQTKPDERKHYGWFKYVGKK